MKGKRARSLHFHFSGHGVRNTDKEKGDVGQCLVGSSGRLFSDTDMKNKLLDWEADKITITLDCCRGWARSWIGFARGTGENLGALSKLSNQEKMFVLYSTPDKHNSSDLYSLTKELYEVTAAGYQPVLISDLSSTVNSSWKRKGIDQRSQDESIKVDGNWKDYMWPLGSSAFRKFVLRLKSWMWTWKTFLWHRGFEAK